MADLLYGDGRLKPSPEDVPSIVSLSVGPHEAGFIEMRKAWDKMVSAAASGIKPRVSVLGPEAARAEKWVSEADYHANEEATLP